MSEVRVVAKSSRKKPPPALLVPTVSVEAPAEELQPLPMVEVLDSLFLSAYSAACDLGLLTSAGITHILNLTRTSRCPNKFEGQFQYCSLQMQDVPSTDILDMLAQAIAFIEQALQNQGRVLVHCYMGKSRAPTVVCGYLAWRFGLTASAAWEMVRKAQPDVDPNIGYFAQVQALCQQSFLKH